MKVFFLKVLMWIEIGVLRVVDMIMQLFSVFSGIEDVAIGESGKGTLLEYFVTNQTVINAFWALFVIGVACTGIFTVIAIVKNMVVVKKTVGKILAKMLTAILSMILVIMCLFGFIYGANVVLQQVDGALAQDNRLTIGQQLFVAGIDDDAWINITPREGCTIREEGLIAIFGSDENKTATDEQGNVYYVFNSDWSGVTPDKVFGVYKKDDLGIFESGEEKDRDGGFVDIDKYDFFIGVPASIIIVVVMFVAVMGLVTRLYDLVFMLLTSPLIMSTLPLDDGAKFKLWRETAISKTLLAYGTVFAVNIYIIILPLLSKLSITGQPTLTTLMRVLLIICGALTISNGQLFFARLLGTDAQESRQAAHGMRTMFAGVMGSARAVKGAARLTFGQYNPFTHTRERGIVQAAGKIANVGATVLTGGVKSGDSYVSVGTGLKNKMGDMKTRFGRSLGENRGVIGGVANGIRTVRDLNNVRKNGLDIDL
ncbi:MAG: Mbov_0396 family ICE element transmembrane protein [Christensenellales bacterium]